MNKKIVLIGAGGFGKEVAWLIERINSQKEEWEILGFIDDSLEVQGKKIGKYNVIGNVDYLRTFKETIYVACCVGNSKTRQRIIERTKENENIKFPVLIDPSVVYADSVNIKEGTIICANNTITVDIEIGSFNLINLDSTIGHDAILEDYVTLYPSVNVSGCVHIGHNTEIGTGSCIIQGINIAEEAIVGAGAVVVKDIPARCTAVGNPAKPIKFF